MYSLIEEKLKESKDNLSRQIFDDKFYRMDVNKGITRLAFVKVFYEDEFNKMLIHGELGRYLEENIKSDNHEMLQNNFIVKSIFGFTKLINIYGLSNEYKDILKVLDEYFINSYTVSYLTRGSKDREKILADMIVNNTIEKNDSVGYIEFSLELIKVAIESGDSNKNEMFDNVFNYIEKMLADGVMAINKLIDGVATHESVISCLKYGYFPLDKFKNIIDKNLRIYRNHSDQDRNIANIKDMETKIIFGYSRILIPALILYKFDSTDDIFEEGKQISGKITELNDLNKLLREKLQIDYAGALSESSKVEIWRDELISKIEKYKNNELIQADFLIENIKNLSENLRNIEKIKEVVEDKEVELAHRNPDKIKKMTSDELLKTINEIYEELSKKDVAEADGIIAYFHRYVTELYENENINEEKLKNIISGTEKTYGIIINNYLSEYDEMALVYIGLVISKLKDKWNKK